MQYTVGYMVCLAWVRCVRHCGPVLPSTAFLASPTDKCVQVGPASAPNWKTCCPKDHIMSRFGNCVGWPNGTCGWYNRNTTVTEHIAREHGLSSTAHGNAAWKSLSLWIDEKQTHGLLVLVALFGSLYWSRHFQWNESAGQQSIFPGPLNSPTIMVEGVPGCRALERHKHLQARCFDLQRLKFWGRNPVMCKLRTVGKDAVVSKDVCISVESPSTMCAKLQQMHPDFHYLWKKGVRGALHQLTNLSLKRWFSFPLLLCAVATRLGTALCCAGLQKLAPWKLPPNHVPSLSQICIEWIMDGSEPHEWQLWGFWQAELLEEYADRAIHRRPPTEVYSPKVTEWLLKNVVPLRDNDQVLEGLFNLVDCVIRPGMQLHTQQALMSLHHNEKARDHLRHINHPCATAECTSEVWKRGKTHTGVQTGKEVAGWINPTRTCRANVELFVEHSAEHAQRHTREELKAH